MKFYSDITKSLYNSAQECEAAEAAHLKAEEEKKNGCLVSHIAKIFRSCGQHVFYPLIPQ